MSHDRARLSALVDGELDHEARERVLSHLAQCDQCRAVVDTERRVKALLRGMPESAPTGDFLTTLNQLGAVPTKPPAGTPAAEEQSSPPAKTGRRRPAYRRGRATGLQRSGLGSQPRTTAIQLAGFAPRPGGGSSRPTPTRPFGYPDLSSARRPGLLRGGRISRRLTVGVAGAASLAGMALVTAFTIGGTGSTAADLKVVPPIQRYTVQHADSVVDLPFTDPGAASATIGDAEPTGLSSTDR